MKKFLFIISGLVAVVHLSACAKKKQVSEAMPEPMSMEALGTLTTQTPTTLESLPPSGPYKPTASEIQTALKNAGYYTAAIDGKIGPLTRKATEDFQKANGLAVDGKVGPKTWAVLSKYHKEVSH